MRRTETATPAIHWRVRWAEWLALPAALFAFSVTPHRSACAEGPAVASPAEQRVVISFAGALAAASGQNPQIAFANERINEAFAQLKGAQVLWLPSIQAGVNYQSHDGPLQNSNGTITDASRSALEAGLGMYAVGGGAPAIPGLSAKFAVADAVFQPRIAEQTVAARQQAATAASHDVLLAAAVAYLNLLRAFGQQAIAEETLAHAEQLAGLTAAFARSGQGNQADADRAQTELSLRRNALAQAVVQTRLASAQLAELLHANPSLVFVPEEPALTPIVLVSPQARTADLIADALSRRPELAESRHVVAEAARRLDRERYAPLLPNVLLDVSQGGYGGGPDTTVTGFRSRFDFDATVYWQLRDFGLGDAAAPRGAMARVEQAAAAAGSPGRPGGPRDRRGPEPGPSLRGQIAVAEGGIRAAAASYRRNLDRIRGGQGLPWNCCNRSRRWTRAAWSTCAVGDYDQWQFRLYRASGLAEAGEVRS